MGFLRRQQLHVESADGTVAEDLVQRDLVREIRQHDANPLVSSLTHLRAEVDIISRYLRAETDLDLPPEDREELAARLHFALGHGHSCMSAEQRRIYGLKPEPTERFTVSRS